MEFNLETININDILNLLKSEEIDYHLADENSAHLKVSVPIVIKIDESHGALRLWGWADVGDIDELEKRRTLNVFNTGSSTIKYSILTDGDVYIEYGMLLQGKVDSVHLIKTIKHFIEKASIFQGVFKSVYARQKD